MKQPCAVDSTHALPPHSSTSFPIEGEAAAQGTLGYSQKKATIASQTAEHCPGWGAGSGLRTLASARPCQGLNLGVTPATHEGGQETASVDHLHLGRGWTFPGTMGIHPFLPAKSHATTAQAEGSNHACDSPKAPFSSQPRLFLRQPKSQRLAKRTRALREATAETTGCKAVLSISPGTEAALPGTCLLLLGVLRSAEAPHCTPSLPRDKLQNSAE